MAKVRVSDYTFAPGFGGSGTVTLKGHHELAQVLLITNTTRNEIIYNFASASAGATSISYDALTYETTIVLTYNTSSHSSTDQLQIFVDQAEAPMTVAPKLFDPVEKLRVSNPQALIDTDFEYSLQATKWESLQLQNNIPGIYQKANEPAFQGSSILSIAPATGGGGYQASATTITRVENGRTGMSTIFQGNLGDNRRQVSFSGLTVPFLGTNYSSGWVGGNGYITFGGGSTQWGGLNNPDVPNLPAIKFFAADMRAYYIGRRYIYDSSGPGYKIIIRWEGSTYGGSSGSTTPSHIAEITLYSYKEQVDVHYIAARNASYGGVNLTGAIQDGPGPSTSHLVEWFGGQNAPALAQNSISPYTVNYAFQIDMGVVSTAGKLAVSVANTPSTPFYVGQPVVLKDTRDPLYLDGAFLITDVNSTTEFLVKTNAPYTYSGEQKTDYSAIYTGGFFNKSALPIANIASRAGQRKARITFSSKHGLFVGSKIYVVDNNAASGAEWVGAFTVSDVESSQSVLYTVYGTTNYPSSTTLSSASTFVYARNEGVSQHRFFDGGVQINPATNSPNAQIIRQTRKYNRYQSGKGIQFSTGVLFMPVYDVRRVFVDTTTYIAGTQDYIEVGFECDQEHGFASPDGNVVPAEVTVSGVEVISGTNPYNGTFQVSDVLDRLTFSVQVPVTGIPTDTTPDGLISLAVTKWSDSVVRSGMFDDQNGLFFEHDGNNLHAVKRFSTTQLTGKVDVFQDETEIIGSNTKFTSQLKEGQYIVIKGQSYLVHYIYSDTSLFISPAYKGPDLNDTKIVSTVDFKIKQSDFNLDKLDGTGPSGYVFDPNKMQMVFIDYSWYGAGKIRWGMRISDGSIIYAHEEKQNNVNTEAYMRSGNLPGRFEIQSLGKRGKIVSQITTTTQTTVDVNESEVADLPDSGRIQIGYEMIGYTKGGLSGNTRTLNLTRNLANNINTGEQVHSIGAGWLSLNQNCSPSLSHWGVSILMDGRFDEDKSYLFTAKNSNRRIISNGTRLPLVTIRLAPSVDYGIPGFYGIRNLINRSALKLESVGVLCTGQFDIEVVLNCESTVFQNQSNWQAAPNGSIAQYIDHSIITGGTFNGGDVVAAFLPDEGSGRYSSTTFNINSIRELGNSIIGGPNVFPDGPDVMTIFATSRSNNASIQARFSWSESQG